MAESLQDNVEVVVQGAVLPGILSVPDGATGLVIFAHGSGSSRTSVRNQMVATQLNEAGIATLLFDLLTEKEKEHYDANVFDMELLSERLAQAVEWAGGEPRLQGMKLGLCGASTGGGAALNVAAAKGEGIKAVVSRGGRPDLADQAELPKVTAPTLLVVGGDDTEVIPLNEAAAEHLTGCDWELKLVPGATHVFSEPGTMEVASQLATDWFVEHLK
jgi:putative phosphoribosyl transferase